MSAWHASATAAAATAPAAEGGAAPGAATSAASATAGEDAGADDAVLKSGWEARVAESGLGSAAGDGEQRQAALLESWKGYKRQFQQGVAAFNQKPKKGIAYMQEQGLVGPTPDDVAQFLAKSQGLKCVAEGRERARLFTASPAPDLLVFVPPCLAFAAPRPRASLSVGCARCSKTLIGDYLGERDDFNLRVMHAYVDALDFGGMEFDGAIRWGHSCCGVDRWGCCAAAPLQ